MIFRVTYFLIEFCFRLSFGLVYVFISFNALLVCDPLFFGIAEHIVQKHREKEPGMITTNNQTALLIKAYVKIWAIIIDPVRYLHLL